MVSQSTDAADVGGLVQCFPTMFLELLTLRNLLVSLYRFGADLVCMEFDYGLWGAYKL